MWRCLNHATRFVLAGVQVLFSIASELLAGGSRKLSPRLWFWFIRISTNPHSSRPYYWMPTGKELQDKDCAPKVPRHPHPASRPPPGSRAPIVPLIFRVPDYSESIINIALCHTN